MTDRLRPRILHIITGLGTGGAESSLVRVLAHTAPVASHAVVSLTTAGTRGAELVALGIPVYALGIARGAMPPTALGVLRSIVREFQPTCVQGWMYHGNLAASLLALTGANTGPVLWNVRHALDAWHSESRALRMLVRAGSLLARQPRRVIYNSHRSAAQHEQRGYVATSTCVVPNGVNTDRFRPDREAGNRIRAQVGIPDHAFVVGMIARVDALKDHDTFLAAIAQQASDDRATWYLLAGSDTAPGQRGEPAPLDARLRALVGARPDLLPRIVRLGERRDIPDIINACDVMTLTSRSEGSPNAIAEAMACGLPCVVTDVGDAARLVGDSGIVVDVGDAAAIAAAWRYLQMAHADRVVRSARALKRVREYCDVGVECATYRALWTEASESSIVSESETATLVSVVPPAKGKRVRHPSGNAVPDISPPRILIVSTVSTTLRAFLLPLADRFRALGWRVDALAAGADLDASIASHFDRTHGIAWSRNPLSLRNVAAVRRIRAVVEAGGYDVVHVHTPIAAFITRFALRQRSRGTVIYTVHGFHAHPGGTWVGNALFRWLERRAAAWTDYLVVMNTYDAELARRDALANVGHVAHHPGIGVDVDRYRPLTSAERQGVRATLGVTPDHPMVAVVAEFNVNKRQRDVISALARMRGNADTALPIVLFIGDGPLRAAVARQARAAGVDANVRFLGQRHDVSSLVGAADALVLASAREGLPRCVLEAMAMGVPAIASMARGSVDLLSDDRGWLFPVGDVAALANALEHVLRDQARALVRARHAVAWVRSVASLNEILTRHEALYGTAVAQQRFYGNRSGGTSNAVVVHQMQ